jgi:pimeloyl-ACP methyl ester carboxylesterase
MWNEMIATDLTTTVVKLELPVYFFSGIYDYTVNYGEAKAYFAKLDAPIKGFYTFANSAHSPIFEEPDKARQILLEDVLGGVTRLADGQ